MGLDASLSIASSGLSALQSEMAVASQNVANANTAGYAKETSSVSSRTAGGQGGGVLVGLTSRTVDTALQSSLYAQNATVSALATTSNALAPIGILQGSTSADSGSSNTLSDAVGNLQTSLTTLEGAPADETSQQAVLTAAGTLTSNIQATAGAYQTQRQSAQEAIVSDVGTANANLTLIGSLSLQISGERIDGVSTADLENQRATAMSALSNVMSVQFKETSTGDMLVATANGLSLPTHATSGPLSTTDATVGVANAYPASIPAITLNGKDVTTSLTGGSLGANVTLRDQTLPTMQAELDSYSQALASRFDAQGVTLFTDASGNLPAASTTAVSPAGQVGFANVIQVNPLVTATPSLIRDGTSSTTSASDASASSTTVIDNLLDYALGTQSKAGTAQPAASSTGLGVNGDLSSPYRGNTDLVSLASTLTSVQGSTISDASDGLTNETAVQTSLSAKVATVSGVSVDDEMSSLVTLQNAYAANAKVVSAVQTMFSALLTAID